MYISIYIYIARKRHVVRETVLAVRLHLNSIQLAQNADKWIASGCHERCHWTSIESSERASERGIINAFTCVQRMRKNEEIRQRTKPKRKTQRQQQRQWQRQMNLWTCDSLVSGLRSGRLVYIPVPCPIPPGESMQPVVMATMAANGDGEGAHKEQSAKI